MAKFGHTTRYENFAKELIHHILAFKECDENFTASVNYVMSNLLYHHCLDVNSHHVQRSLQGISFKMGIHGHHKKSERLHSITEKFLASPVFEDKGDLKWSILSLLIELGQHPARDSLSSSLNSEHNTITDSEITGSRDADWIRELKEKSFHLPDKDETLSEWSDDDEMRRSCSLGIEADQQQVRQKSTTQDQKKAISVEEQERRMSLVKEAHLSKSWITSSVQRPYWNPDSEKLIINTMDNPHKKPSNVLTEYVVMRECIWLLLYPASGFIFLQNGEHFEIRPVEIASLSKVNLRQILQPVTSAASKILIIDKWLTETQLAIQRKDVDHLGTMQSYSDGLRKWRDSFNVKVNALENGLFGEEESPTLLWFLHELEPPLSSLSTIYNVHFKSMNFPQDSPLKKTFKLLSLLMQGVEGGLRGSDRACLLVLLKFALKNHLINLYYLLWDSHPHSESLLQEFGIVKRNSGNNQGKVQKNYSLDESDYMNFPGLEFLRALRGPLMEIHELKSIVKDLEISSKFEPDHLVKQIESELNLKFYIKDTIYSANELKIEESASCTKILEVRSQNENKESEAIVPNPNKSTKENNLEETKQEKETIETNGIIAETKILKLYNEDVYLDLAFEEDECISSLKGKEQNSPFDQCDLQVSMGLDRLLTNCLLLVVRERYIHWGNILMKSLCETHGLRQQMKVFVAIVLLSSTCGMDDFYSYLFLKIDNKDPVEEHDLTENLQYCLSFTHPTLAEYFGIFLKAKERKEVSGIPTNDAFPSSISIDFMDQWPLSIILTDSIIPKYNKLFAFCLMLKRAVFTLGRLHFKEIAGFDAGYSWDESGFSLLFEEADEQFNLNPSDGEKESLPLTHRIHRLQLLRHWLLYFANVLHDHFLIAILVPFSQRIEELLQKEHFADFVREHEVLLNSVCRQCLLNEDKLSPIQVALSQLFSTVEDIRKLWRGSPDKITEQELRTLEDQYSLCHRFMAKFLSSLASVQFCPLVEGLSQSLMYNCPS